MAAYLNQDYDLIADSIEGVMHEYIKSNDQETIRHLRKDIANFTAQHQASLDDAFGDAYGFNFAPKLWNHSAASFLTLVDAMLGDEARKE